MIYTTVPDKATGDTVTETNWDLHLRDNLNNLITPPACLVYNAGAGTATTSGVTQTLSWDSEGYDTDSMHDATTNPSRISLPTAGKYRLTAQVVFPPAVAGSLRAAGIRSTAGINIGWFQTGVPSSEISHYLQVTATFNTTSTTDYCYAVALQDSGGAVTIGGTSQNSWFAAERIG